MNGSSPETVMELDVDGTREHDGNLHENGDDVCKAVVEMEFPAGRQVVLLDESLHACRSGRANEICTRLPKQLSARDVA